MAEGDIIMASQKELKRLHIVRKVLDKELKQVEAKDVLNLSDRQIRRIVRTVRREGDRGIVHKSRRKPSNIAIPKRIKARTISLYKEKYKGFGPTFANEKLLEIDKIEIGTQTLRNWLIAEGEWKLNRNYKESIVNGGKESSVLEKWCRWMARIMTGWKEEVLSWF